MKVLATTLLKIFMMIGYLCLLLLRICKDLEESARISKNLQESARTCKNLQESARFSEILQDSTRFCKILQDSAKSTNILQHEVVIGPAEEVLASSIDSVEVSALHSESDFPEFTDEIENEIKIKLLQIKEGNYTGDRLLYSGFFCFATLLDYFRDDVVVFADHEEVLSKAKDIGERYSSYKNRDEGHSDWAKYFPSPYVSWDALNISSKNFIFEINWL